MIPNAFRFLIEVLFYSVRRWITFRFSYSFTGGRFLFRRVSLFVTRSILEISSVFNEDVGVRFTDSRFYSFKAVNNAISMFLSTSIKPLQTTIYIL